MLQYLRSLIFGRRGEHGASAVEYGLLVAGIAAMSVAIVLLLGGVVQKSYRDSCSRVGTGGSTTTVTC